MNKRKLIQAIKELKRAFNEGRPRELIVELENFVSELPDDPTKSQSAELTLPREITKGSWALFSDGACRGNPGPGSWGMLGQNDEGVVLFEASGVEMLTTNNRMELAGAIEALRALKNHWVDQLGHSLPVSAPVYLYSDSRYVLDGLEQWIEGWKARGWKKADKKPPENLEFWQELDELKHHFESLNYVWVKGHSGHPQNERCDRLANEALDEAGL
jgi:ribonuclease HI